MSHCARICANYLRFYCYDNNWDLSEKETYTYDENNHKKSLLLEEWEDKYWNKRYAENFNYNSNNILENYSSIGFNPDGSISGDSIAYYLSKEPSTKNELTESLKSVEIFPNPNNGKFTVRSDNNFNSIEVFNINGERILNRFNIKPLKSDNIELPENYKGIYIIKIDNNRNKSTGKILIE